MKRPLSPIRRYGGTIQVPGDKSIAHRAALLSLLAHDRITITNFPDNADCASSLNAAKSLGVKIDGENGAIVLTPPEALDVSPDTIIDCGNSGTTARLLSGIVAGSGLTATLAGDESLSRRPMKRIIDPLTAMGAELFADEDHLPIKISGKKLLPYEYRLPVPSAQVKSAVLLAGLASSCSVDIKEDVLTRDHTERMISELGGAIEVAEIKPVLVTDPIDPRKKRQEMPADFKKEIHLSSQARLSGGNIDIPGDLSTAAFFMAAAAISKQSITIENLGLNPTRTEFLDHLRTIGCAVEIKDRAVISNEPRGTVTVTGGKLKARKLGGGTIVGLIDEIPIIAVIAAFAEGTTLIRDAAELRVKESDRLAAVAENLHSMGVKCGVLEDGLAIEGGKELPGTDFKSFGDHRIAMAFSIASLFLVGPSTIDDDSVVGISCPNFYSILEKITG
ncbi:MAG TPA: 3-phosphoshikimate 1-carboxyvinyltransferase [candidate division Zixibacteria bacterium]|nr:3-phosphoshikimate 1-carboxyvinyltransferase [candidate division Zixibacteria bacterium]